MYGNPFKTRPELDEQLTANIAKRQDTKAWA